MGVCKILMIFGSSLFLIEGFMFSVFPAQTLAVLRELEPRSLQIAGMIETLVATVLLASVVLEA